MKHRRIHGKFFRYLLVGFLCVLIGSVLLLLVLNGNTSTNDRSKAAETSSPPAKTVSTLAAEQLRTNTRNITSLGSSTNAPPAQMQRLLEERKQLLLQVIKDDPLEILRQAKLTKNISPQLSTAQQNQLERTRDIEGTLHSRIADDFVNKTSTRYVTLRTSTNELFNLHFVEISPSLPSGARVRVSGVQVDTEFVVEPKSGKEFQVLASNEAQALVSPVRKVAVILINFQNDTSQHLDPEQVRRLTYTNIEVAGVNSYYKEVSADALHIEGALRSDGDIYGYYTVPYSSTECAFTDWGEAAEQAAITSGFVRNRYDHIIFSFPYAPSCFWAGMGSTGGIHPGEVYINGRNYYVTSTVAHELGHNLGLDHAGSMSCTDTSGQPASISDTCTVYEYGDPYDAMNNDVSDIPRHFSNYNKTVLGFLPASASQTVVTSGDYTLLPVNATENGTKVLKIAAQLDGTAVQYYYLEYRRPYGIFDQFEPGDAVVNGVSIRTDAHLGSSTSTIIVDTTPGDFITPHQLLVGKTFEDVKNKIKVTTLSTSETQARVHIEVDELTCLKMRAQVEVLPSIVTALPGEVVSYSAKITNLNTPACGPTNYSLGYYRPSGFTLTATTASVTIAPGASSYVYYTLASAVSSLPGSYTTGIRAFDGALDGSGFATYKIANLLNPSPSASPTLIPEDLNNDGVVDALDIKEILLRWPLFLSLPYDLFGDNKINTFDYAKVWKIVSGN